MLRAASLRCWCNLWVGIAGPPPPQRWIDGLPTVYLTVKAKCWATKSRLCSRASHSCMRSISSWFRFLMRQAMRLNRKAWRCATARLAFGGGTASMRTAAQDMSRRIARLQPGAKPGLSNLFRHDGRAKGTLL